MHGVFKEVSGQHQTSAKKKHCARTLWSSDICSLRLKWDNSARDWWMWSFWLRWKAGFPQNLSLSHFHWQSEWMGWAPTVQDVDWDEPFYSVADCKNTCLFLRRANTPLRTSFLWEREISNFRTFPCDTSRICLSHWTNSASWLTLERVGIIGRTGAGKSSLLRSDFQTRCEGMCTLMARIYGSGLHDLRRQMTVIPQNSLIFRASIRENLDPFKTYSDDRIHSVLEREEFIEHQPDGLDSTLSFEQVSLSSGQK